MKVARILLIDDEPDIRTIASLSLEQVGGYQLTTAPDGRRGLELARDDPPDLILLDVMMPELDGLQTLAELRRDPKTAAIPVIFMTARVQEKEVQSYLEAGGLGVVHKPFDPMQLPEEIRRLTADV